MVKHPQLARVTSLVVLSHWQAARLIIAADQYDYQKLVKQFNWTCNHWVRGFNGVSGVLSLVTGDSSGNVAGAVDLAPGSSNAQGGIVGITAGTSEMPSNAGGEVSIQSAAGHTRWHFSCEQWRRV